ncbi:hypothetical protein EVAR_9201_1 [Eumeta japonica]|uniref:Uncharacterized protein n=1 Tax=Eumeta variegata TaxID=151549 RepID=A0A4C1WPM9_EUMVA|nr:hypothetical protein EVAR_9201_1 [Eumeta japonica]
MVTSYLLDCSGIPDPGTWAGSIGDILHSHRIWTSSSSFFRPVSESSGGPPPQRSISPTRSLFIRYHIPSHEASNALVSLSCRAASVYCQR